MSVRIVVLFVILSIFLGVVFIGQYKMSQSSTTNNQQVSRSEKQISWRELKQEDVIDLINEKYITLVDLREVELYQKGHVPGAINIPFAEIKSRYTELNKNKQIVFICHTGRMGEESSEFLIKQGYQRVGNLKGGMEHWEGPWASSNTARL